MADSMCMLESFHTKSPMIAAHIVHALTAPSLTVNSQLLQLTLNVYINCTCKTLELHLHVHHYLPILPICLYIVCVPQ